jgi:hypothetical protein
MSLKLVQSKTLSKRNQGLELPLSSRTSTFLVLGLSPRNAKTKQIKKTQQAQVLYLTYKKMFIQHLHKKNANYKY